MSEASMAGPLRPFRDPFGRVAGLAGLAVFVLALIINVVLLWPPPDPPVLDTPIADVAVYVAVKSDHLALGHGLRYLAQASLLIFGVGLYRHVIGPSDGADRAWAMVGVLATVWIPAIGIIAQSLEGVAVWQAAALADQRQFALVLWGLSVFLWNATLVPFSAMILGFSLAGRASGALPRWLVVLGIAAAASGFAAAFTAAARAGAGSDIPAGVFFLLVSPWQLIMSVRLLGGSRTVAIDG
jgi:hypothetical protein